MNNNCNTVLKVIRTKKGSHSARKYKSEDGLSHQLLARREKLNRRRQTMRVRPSGRKSR